METYLSGNRNASSSEPAFVAGTWKRNEEIFNIAELVQTIAELLRSLRADHLTILLVEHDMEFVMSLVDRIVVLDFGSKLCEGAPAAIRSDARVQEAYLGGVA